MAQRIQRKRTKGWMMPEGAISVTRPGRFGNPFVIGGRFKIGNGGSGFMYLQRLIDGDEPGFEFVRDNAHAVEMFRRYRKTYPLSPVDVDILRGKDLACWCALDQPCHADVYLEIVNNEVTR